MVPDVPSTTTRPLPGLAPLARPSGGFAMLALDQRVSLENMFRAAGRDATVDGVDRFRDLVLTACAPHVSAVLLERGYLGRTGIGAWDDAGAGFIVAADDLEQAPGEPAQGSGIDRAAVTVGAQMGADALKLLVIWLSGADDEQHARQAAMVDEFVGLAHAKGMLALVECIAHGGTRAGERPVTPDELLSAAAALGRHSDIYKAQVPIHGGDSAADVERLAREMTATVGVPWVVLSTGVPDARFPELVGASCRGGASGFRAGRAIWSRAVAAGSAQETRTLLEGSVRDLERLVAIVDAEARPYQEVIH